MADRFFPDCPRDPEFTNGHWVHPAEPGSRHSYYKYGRTFDPSAIVVGVDGACCGNGQPWAVAAYGIYFGPGNAWNEDATLDEGETGGRATNQRAELWAALRALRIAHSLHSRWPQIFSPSGDDDSDYYVDDSDSDEGAELEKVIVKADSEYVVKGMTEWVYKWLDNGWENCRGLPVVNADLFQKLIQQVRTLKGLGLEVLFWHVPREDNSEADQLANDALDDT